MNEVIEMVVANSPGKVNSYVNVEERTQEVGCGERTDCLGRRMC